MGSPPIPKLVYKRMVVKVCTRRRRCALLSALQLDVVQIQYFLTRLLALRRCVQKSNIGAVMIARADCKPRNLIFPFSKQKKPKLHKIKVQRDHTFSNYNWLLRKELVSYRFLTSSNLENMLYIYIHIYSICNFSTTLSVF